MVDKYIVNKYNKITKKWKMKTCGVLKGGGMVKRWKALVGILLIVTAAVGLIYWETWGREAVLMDEVLVAKEEIPRGAVLDEGMFATAKVERANRMEGALGSESLPRILGKETDRIISKNQQIAAAYFQEQRFQLKGGRSFFSLPQEWIAMRSSSLRRGDTVALYQENSLKYLGEYQVAFVKDDNENEVKDLESSGQQEAIDRENSTAVISHIEIISTLEEYNAIAAACTGGGNGLPGRIIIVQKGEQLS